MRDTVGVWGAISQYLHKPTPSSPSWTRLSSTSSGDPLPTPGRSSQPPAGAPADAHLTLAGRLLRCETRTPVPPGEDSARELRAGRRAPPGGGPVTSPPRPAPGFPATGDSWFACLQGEVLGTLPPTRAPHVSRPPAFSRDYHREPLSAALGVGGLKGEGLLSQSEGSFERPRSWDPHHPPTPHPSRRVAENSGPRIADSNHRGLEGGRGSL